MNPIKPGAKERQRILLACNGCRKKRTKCDGGQPQCGACRYREEQCEYTQVESKRRPPSKQYVKALEMRVAHLEEKLSALQGSGKEPLSPPEDESSQTSETTVAPADLIYDRSSTSPTRTDSPDSIDEITDVLGSFAIGDAGEMRYFGPRSNFNLIQDKDFSQDISSLGARLTGVQSAQCAYGASHVSDELRDHLLDLFWRWQNSWQYLVPRESFLRDLYVERSSRFCTPLLLTAIFALSSRYSDRVEVRTDPNDPNTAGNLFAAQAKSMLWCECEAPTTSTVQAAGLLALQSCSVDKESLGWTFCGMAIRMAFNLGLHLDCSEHVVRGMIRADDAEARTVTWWGVYVLDELFAVGLGRPSGIMEFDITARKPALQPNEPLSEWRARKSGGLFVPTWHVVTNVIYTCELLKISDTLDKLYASGNPWTKQEREEHVMQTHLQLLAFHNRLPKALRITGSDITAPMPQVYQLHLQYHASMILLHRPLFQAFKHNARRNNTVYEETIHSQACKLSAEKISSILRSYRTNYTLRYIPISAVQCAFTAGVIHLLDATTTDASARSTALHRLRAIMDSLTEMRETWQWSDRSIRALNTLAKEWGVILDHRANSSAQQQQQSVGPMKPSIFSTFDFALADFDVGEWWSAGGGPGVSVL